MRNEFTSSTISFFMPSMLSSSSKPKSNFYRDVIFGAAFKLTRYAYGFAGRLVCRVVPHLEVGVRQRLLAADPLGGVEAKHLGEQIDCKGVRVREKSRERNPRLDRQRTNVVLSLDSQKEN